MSEVMVLRCGQCNKPFDKESTLKRHGYYCRSRKAGHDSIRVRSCISCARRKARCDNKQSGCSRCISKGIECHYPAKTVKITTRQNDLPKNQQITAPLTAPRSLVIDHRLDETNFGQVFFDDTFPSDQDFTNIGVGSGFQPWNLPEASFADLLNAQVLGDTIQYPTSEPPAPTPRLTPGSTQTSQAQQPPSMTHTSIPASPTSSIRSLALRPKVHTGTQRIANLLLHNLKSFPLMMLRHGTLPPFIHPSLISSEVDSSRMEPLTNCISLMHMISSRIQGSRKLFWRNVRLECERLCAEHLHLDHLELLAGMQALCIYILIRLDEGETDHNNFDSLLVRTVIVIAIRLAVSTPTHSGESAPHEQDLEESWKDWLREESRRRLSVVYRVLNMLIYFEPSGICELQADLIIAPLPAKKQLWEAPTSQAWHSETTDGAQEQTEFGLAADGELVKLQDGQRYCGDATLLYEALGSCRRSSGGTRGWEEWCLGMDGFGGLVMLAASLVG
ncbi:hypothetical protein BKA65DRAFT_72282 [Rhexocercosporidium sp. MPI-PUGE-AT-0058]|nr:hypothetical protein BKA65DRAFT_72282 [Rhexocercosporidium sp. MPI-PUGE-AT-0058]